jgi:L-ascorbate metabolism protein UlaG (beta-lactamase superfamily)
MTRYPVSDHYDGRRFFNPGVDTDKTLRDFVRWVSANQRQPWPRRVANEPHPPPAALVPEGTIATTFIGQSTFLIQGPGCNMLTDPMFSEVASPFASAGPRRVRAPAIALEELPPIDLVLLSHDHYDHLDLPSLRQLQDRWDAPIVTGLGVGSYLRRKGIGNAVELDWWEVFDHTPDLRSTSCRPSIGPAAARLTAARRCGAVTSSKAPPGAFFSPGTPDTDRTSPTSAGGWANPTSRFCRSAHTSAVVHARPAHEPEDAVRAHIDLGARRSIGMHFGTFQLTDEAMTRRSGAGEARQAHGFRLSIPRPRFRGPVTGCRRHRRNALGGTRRVARMEWSEEGIVIGARRHGETDAIIEVLTEGHGRHLGLVKGGRSRRMRPIIQPGNTLALTWRARLDEHLGNFRVEPMVERSGALMTSNIGAFGLAWPERLCGCCRNAIRIHAFTPHCRR